MIVITTEDIKQVKTSTATCICSRCGKQYTVSLNTLKKTNKIECRKCFNKLKKKTLSQLNYPELNKRGFIYNNVYFDSSWKLAFFIWLSDNDKNFVFQPRFPLRYKDSNGVSRCVYPDFLVEGKFCIIKGKAFFNDKDEPYNTYKKEYWTEEYNTLVKNNVSIIKQKDADVYVDYVNKKYGKDFLRAHKL